MIMTPPDGIISERFGADVRAVIKTNMPRNFWHDEHLVIS